MIAAVAAGALAGAPGPGEVLVRPLPGHRGGLAQAVLAAGLDALPHGAPPLRRICLPPGPALDDLLAGWLCQRLDAGRMDAAEAKALAGLCEYAAQLREGLLPGTVAPERSLAGVYLALLELHREHPEALVERGLRLIAAALAAVRAGRSPLHDDLLSGDEAFSREQTYLATDQRRYQRDREAGTVWAGRVGHLDVHLLWLRQPTSILFRFFAYHDAQAPDGAGFDFVLAERAGRGPGRRHVALFADPTRRLPLGGVLGPLALRLSALEAGEAQRALPAEGGGAKAQPPLIDPWYDGTRHQHQRLASPRPGTALPPSAVERALRRALRLRGPGARLPAWGAGLAAGLLCVLMRVPHPAPRQVEVVVRSDWQAHRLPQGPPLPGAEREALVQQGADGRIRNYALLMAASAYAPRSQGGLGPLGTPWRDACVLRDLLVRRFGYRRRDVVVLGDSPCLREVAGPPTRAQLLWTVEHMQVRPDDSLLFYYAGHGDIEQEPGGRYGYLQPLGWERPGLSREDRGLRMRVLAELLRDKVAARHQLLLIDACHSGETAVLRGSDPAALDRLEAPVRAGWRERPVYAVITAAGSGDLALEERLLDAPLPHSLFVRALIEGLAYAPAPTAGGAACQLRADEDPRGRPDGLVTDGEVFKYVARRVPELRAAIDVPGLPDELQRQVPEWNPWAAAPRMSGPAPRIGEFLLIPRDQPPSACDGAPEPDPEECRPSACRQ